MFASLLGVPSHSGGSSSSKAHKHASRRSTSSTSTTSHSKPKPSRSAQQRSVAPGTASASFLFVVNELQVDYEPASPQEQPLTDQWLNTMPPQHASAYVGELVGTVFRYRDGVVSPAHGYLWHRPALNTEGSIVRLDPTTGTIDGWPAVYRAQTVFACSPLLAMIVTDGDASLGHTFPRRMCGCMGKYSGSSVSGSGSGGGSGSGSGSGGGSGGGGGGVYEEEDDERCSTWSHLHFVGGGDDRRGGGVSYVNSYASGDPFVAGDGPSWVPGLVPAVYRNTRPGVRPSRGLSGELPIVIALVGFHGRPGRASDVFQSRKWDMGQWLGSSRPSPYLPKSGECPRGLFVQVCADNLVDGLEDCEENSVPAEIWEQMLQDLEYRTVLVQG